MNDLNFIGIIMLLPICWHVLKWSRQADSPQERIINILIINIAIVWIATAGALIVFKP